MTLNSTTSTMRDISNTRRPLSTRCCSYLVWTVRQLAVEYEMTAQVRDSQTQSCTSPRRISARRPLKTHTANKCAGITRCMTRRHSRTCSGCAKPFTFRANTFPSPERNISCHLNIPQETVYFVSMNIRLHSPPEVNGTFYTLQFQPQENSLSTFYILNLK